jgi:hypothetical protein
MSRRYVVAAALALEAVALVVAAGGEAFLALGLSTPAGDDVGRLAGAELVPLLIAVLAGTAVALVRRRAGRLAVGLVVTTVFGHVAAAAYIVGVHLAVDGLDLTDPLLWRAAAAGAVALALAVAVVSAFRSRLGAGARTQS